MNILQLVPELNVGGVETGVMDVAAGLVKRGHKAVVVSNGGKLLKELQDLGAVHYKLPIHRKNLIVIFKMIPKLAEIIYKEDIDVVHARSRVPALIGFFAVRFMHSRLYKRLRDVDSVKPIFITTCHGYYSKHLFSRVMGWGKFVIANSQVVAKHMADDFDVPRERIRIIPRGVDLSKFNFKLPDFSGHKNNEFVIAVVARITPIKGHVYFIRAISRVIRQMPNIKVWIIGDASENQKKYKEQLVLLVKRLGLNKYIEFLGMRSDIPQLLSKTDLLVMPSVGQEAFGRVLIEAASAGVPIVASKVGGIIDFITHRSNGLLVEPEDIKSLTDAIVEILNNKDLAVSLANRARKDVEASFGLDKMIDTTIELYHQAVAAKILIIKLSSMGDVILAIPSIKAIRKKFPKAHITVLVGIESSEILRNCPYIDSLIISKRLKSLYDITNLGSLLREKYFDMVIDLQNSLKSHIVSWLGGIHKRFGYDNGKFSFLYNYKIKGAKLPIPPVEHQFRLLSLLGISSDSYSLELWPQKEDFEYVKDFLNSHWVGDDQVLVGIHPGGSLKWQTKRWPIKNYAQLIDALAKEHIRVVVTGSASDGPLVRELFLLTKAKPIDAVGKTSILELAALIKRCNVYISTDTAPMHVAASMGAPLIALFGPTDPIRHLPPAKDYTVIKKDIKCSPCYRPVCNNTLCMNKIGVDEVLKTVKKYIKS